MNTINDQNIEQWLFDYTEGNLTIDKKNELISFIENNPQYKEDLNSWTMAYIKAPLPEVDLKKLLYNKNLPIKNTSFIQNIALLL